MRILPSIVSFDEFVNYKRIDFCSEYDTTHYQRFFEFYRWKLEEAISCFSVHTNSKTVYRFD